MAKEAFIRARIEPDLKFKAERVLQELGITPTQAICMLYKRVARDLAYPVELKIPNDVTRRTMEETDRGVGIESCKNIDELFEKIGIKRAPNKNKKTIQKRCRTCKKTQERSSET